MKIKIPEIGLKATGFANLFDVDNHIRKILSPVVNQINVGKADEGELAEVVETYDLEDKLPELKDDDVPNYQLLGAIRFRKVYSQQYLTDDKLPIAYPLNLNLVDFPIKGETVFIQKIYDKFYYTDRVNQYNNPNNSSAIGASQRFKVAQNNTSQKTLETAESGIVEDKATTDEVFLGSYFQPNFNIRPLMPNEGDTLVQGRFGNTLRLGSVENSPTIKLRAGQLADFDKFDAGEILMNELENKPVNAPLEENIDLDASSMWMTTNETVSLTPATLEDNNIYPTEVAPAEFSGKQIILNSGRLIFNSKENGILGFSNGPIDFSTLNTFGVAAKQDLNLYSPTIKVGRDGENGKTKSISLLGQDIYLQNKSGYTFVTSKGIELGSSNLEPAVKGDTLEEILSELMDVVSDLSSAVATIVTTPITIGVLATPTPQPYAREASRAYQALSSLATLSIKLNTMKSRVVTLQ